MPIERASNAYQPVGQNWTSQLASSNNAVSVRRKPVPGVSPELDDEVDDHDNSKQASDQHGVWTTGLWARLPARAALSLLGILACTAAAVAILVVSDGADVQDWSPVSPSVYLATLSVVANTLLGFAVAEGLVILFWRTLLHGSPIKELSRNWECGYSSWQAIAQGFRRGGRVTAIARLVTLISLFRGPLYQRASLVDSNYTHDTRGSLELLVAQHLPDGYSGISVYSRVAGTRETARLSSAFTQIMNGYTSRSNMRLEHQYCGDTCSAVVKGFNFRVDCATTQTSTDYDNSSPNAKVLFGSSVTLYNISRNPDDIASYFAGLRLNATFHDGKIEELEKGYITRLFLTSHVCILTPGVMEHTIDLSRGTVSLSPRDNDTFIEAIDLISPTYLGGTTTIGGFQYAGDYLFSSRAYQNFAGAVSTIELDGSLANQMLANTTSYYTFNDPMDLMLDAMREIAFRASLKAGAENATTLTNAAQNTAYAGRRTYSIYRTDYLYLGLAVALSFVGVATTAGTFYGWWQLGRNVSFNPFELGKAFRAPLLTDAGSNVSPHAYPTCLRERRIRYGGAVDNKSKEEPVVVSSDPHSTTTTSSMPDADHHHHDGYLVIDDDVGDIRSPRAGDAFGV